MPHSPFHIDPMEALEGLRQARQKMQDQIARNAEMNKSYAGKFQLFLERGKGAGGGLFGLLSGIGPAVKSLRAKGFNDNEIANLFEDIDKDQEKYLGSEFAGKYGVGNIKSGKINAEQFDKFISAYVDEANKQYERVLDYEDELLKEDQANRELDAFTRQQEEAKRLSAEEQAQRTDKARQAEKSKEYLAGKQRQGRIAVPRARRMR